VFQANAGPVTSIQIAKETQIRIFQNADNNFHAAFGRLISVQDIALTVSIVCYLAEINVG
jgi:hypothetical protein